MKIPELNQIHDVVKDNLDPCLNEHVAHITEKGIDPPEAWITCGDEELIPRLVINPAGSHDQAAHFFKERMTRHEAHAWYAIAVVLSAEVEGLSAEVERLKLFGLNRLTP